MLLLSPEECYFIKSLMIHCLYLMIFDDTLATQENRARDFHQYLLFHNYHCES
jgi:hypothetical protein